MVVSEIHKILEQPAALEFIKPVEEERAPNYYEIIVEPMCLSHMATKVFEGAYKTVKMFCEDFELIVKNCEEYNGKDSEYMDDVQELRERFHQLIENHFADDNLSTLYPQGIVTPSKHSHHDTTDEDDTDNQLFSSEDLYGGEGGNKKGLHRIILHDDDNSDRSSRQSSDRGEECFTSPPRIRKKVKIKSHCGVQSTKGQRVHTTKQQS